LPPTQARPTSPWRPFAVAGLLGASRAPDGSLGRLFIGACDDPGAYAEARADGGRHIVVKLIEAESNFRGSLEKASAELVAAWSRKPDLHHRRRIARHPF
jgi:hypothetical protein